MEPPGKLIGTIPVNPVPSGVPYSGEFTPWGGWNSETGTYELTPEGFEVRFNGI